MNPSPNHEKDRRGRIGEQRVLPGKRAIRVGDQIRREIADLLMRRVKDPRCQGITLTGVDVSKDLRHARVYYSLIGSPEDVQKVQSGLDSAKGYIKREIGLRLDLKYIPDIVFRYDPTLEKGDHLEKLFRKMKSMDDPDTAG